MKQVSATLYARAFIEGTAGAGGRELDRRVERFVALIARNGDAHKFPAIVRECENAARRGRGRHLLLVESARPLSGRARASLETAFAQAATDTEDAVRPELVAGVRLTVDEEWQLDASLAHLLNEVFSQ